MKKYDDDMQDQVKPLYPSRCLSISLREMEEAEQKALAAAADADIQNKMQTTSFDNVDVEK